jgi:hypothetical protein
MEPMSFTTRLTCRVCDKPLATVLDLGNLCVNGFPKPGEPDPLSAPLELTICDSCGLAQLRHTVDPDLLYRKFWYRSSVTDTMQKALADVVRDIKQNVSVLPGDRVIDIGSNDNFLLKQWPKDLVRVGFEPARNIMPEGTDENGIHVLNDYFHALSDKARVITAIAMFYDLENPNQFLQDVRETLTDDGVFVVQLAYMGDTITKNDFANICHEHLEYYSLTTLVEVLERNGLHPFSVSFNDVNGGSIRVMASPTKRERSTVKEIAEVVDAERRAGFHTRKLFEDFAARVREMKFKVRHMLERCPRVYGYGASTKGNTMLQYWGLTREELPAIAERDSNKIGLETCGTRIPIVGEIQARMRARTFLVLPWHFRTEIMAREREWMLGGGRFIFPCPLVEMVPR